MIIAIDSTGIKVTNRGEWMREKWRIHCGWIKGHVVIGRKTRNILSMEVTDETVLDETCCTFLIDSAQDSLLSGTIKTVLADRSYDPLTIFNDLEERHISSSIRIRSNASRDPPSGQDAPVNSLIRDTRNGRNPRIMVLVGPSKVCSLL